MICGTNPVRLFDDQPRGRRAKTGKRYLTFDQLYQSTDYLQRRSNAVRSIESVFAVVKEKGLSVQPSASSVSLLSCAVLARMLANYALVDQDDC